MRTKQLFTLAAIVSALLLSACILPAQPLARPAALAVTCEDFAGEQSASSPTALIDREITVPVGVPFTVSLCSNPGTGYQWEDPQVSDTGIIQPLDHKFTPTQSGTVGAPGVETWTFRTSQSGVSTISFAYSRPWTGGEKGTWQVNLKVTAN